jgi:hypothetical protein
MKADLCLSYRYVGRIEVERYSDGHIILWLWGQPGSSSELESIRLTGIGLEPVSLKVTDHLEAKED